MIKDMKKCCGCGACRDICPKKCIVMKKTDEGFLYPQINSSECVNCGLCDTVCPVQSSAEKRKASRGYIAFAKNNAQRESGSSGGVFGACASYVIKNGGVVFGAGFDEALKLKQYCVSGEKDLPRLYKSKYLQCDTNDFYKAVKKQLNDNKFVLVCNTPCNISALKNYLKRDYENLLTVDFVCHGVPSQDFFDKCMSWYEAEKGMKITGYTFRKKINGASTPHLFEIQYKKDGKIGAKTDLYLKDPFYNAFQKRLSIRSSCHSCNYASPERVSDITIGDFHDVDKVKSGYDRMRGVSMVLVNSEKGIRFFELIENGLDICEVDADVLIENNECLMSSTPMPAKRKDFFENLENKGVKYLAENELNYKKEFKKLVYYKMPKQIRAILKKVILGGI